MAEEFVQLNEPDSSDLSYLKEKMAENDDLERLSEIYKLMGDPTRMKILYALTLSELCVSDISELLDMTQSAVSHQLRLLRASRLVKYRKAGKNVYYSLGGNDLDSVIKAGIEEISG
ncbi:ArsR/SmtB family transcription factor [Limisalsivibrio acetivorans]|uniref:ArsR/SmtB family transcription factor n=1 Tax=Limisalsivibrio acetivorans TaxID=1304888 RepID=UPI0003B6A0C1|nr:metalloregulator ArsR/SmtB family transcription factor [Limisalsivibrio acetivorans]